MYYVRDWDVWSMIVTAVSNKSGFLRLGRAVITGAQTIIQKIKPHMKTSFQYRPPLGGPRRHNLKAFGSKFVSSDGLCNGSLAWLIRLFNGSRALSLLIRRRRFARRIVRVSAAIPRSTDRLYSLPGGLHDGSLVSLRRIDRRPSGCPPASATDHSAGGTSI